MTATPRIAFLASRAPDAQAALAALQATHGCHEPGDADVLCALGGDGFMLHTLHRYGPTGLPVYGMKLGAVGFLMNHYEPEGLVERIGAAHPAHLRPLEMTAITESGAPGKPHVFSREGLGESFVVVVSDAWQRIVLLIVLGYEAVRAAIDAHPTILWVIVRLLARRLRNTDESLADAVFLDVPARTAKRLLEIAGDADQFRLPMTQEDLAGLVGASRERVNKALSLFTRLGWIEVEGRNRYKIIDRQALHERATL